MEVSRLTTTADLDYTPTPGYVGSDSFTFHVLDPQGSISSTQTVDIQVDNSLSVGPWRAVAQDYFETVGSYGSYGYGALEGTITGDVLDVETDLDGDHVTAQIYGSANGVSLSPDGTFSYTGSGTTFRIRDYRRIYHEWPLSGRIGLFFATARIGHRPGGSSVGRRRILGRTGPAPCHEYGQ